jgi:hypothetical protein
MKTENRRETDEEFIARIAAMCPPKPKPKPKAAVEMPKAAMPAVSLTQAEALHRQSSEVLAERQEEELQELKERQARAERYQATLNFWAEQRLFAQEQAERFRESGIERFDREVIWRGAR